MTGASEQATAALVPTLLDGGLATTLQARGLPPFTPVDGWLLDRPDDVAAVHAAFASAGSEVILAGTFRALPPLQPRWEAVVDAAVAAAVAGAAGRAEIAASVGPAGSPDAPWDGDPAPFAVVAGRLADDPRVRRLVLETFVDPAEARAAVRAVRDAWSGPLVACLSPRPDGALWSGRAVAPALASLRDGGADAVGLNCGPGVLSAARAAAAVGLRVDWLKPNADEAGTDPAACAMLLEVAAGVGACFVGGCCGWDPAAVARLGAARGRSSAPGG